VATKLTASLNPICFFAITRSMTRGAFADHEKQLNHWVPTFRYLNVSNPKCARTTLSGKHCRCSDRSDNEQAAPTQWRIVISCQSCALKPRATPSC
jgi:hypothetical protein